MPRTEENAMRKAALHNLGCKVNAYETEAMTRLLKEAGYEIVPFEEKADVYVINTCTVTNIADRKSRQMLHRAKKRNPEAVVVAAGCYVQVAEDKLTADGAVDVIIGNNRKKDLVGILEEYFNGRRDRKSGGRPDGGEGCGAETGRESSAAETGEESSCRTDGGEGCGPGAGRESSGAETGGEGSGAAASGAVSHVIDIAAASVYEALSVSAASGHTRAFIKIQDGCNQFCSYCIIPYARGRVRSRAAGDVAAEAEALAAAGYREIVITGIHISSYGLDMPEESRVDLTGLLELLNRVEGIKRIRLGSLEPRIVTEDFVRRIAALETICPHFHLSLQSGCDATLRRMNRHYTAEEYAEGCRLLRRYFDRPAITTDVITGFPGETEEEFAQTVSLIRQIGFYELHVFPYSRREGTRAAAMPDQVDEAVKKERSARLIRLGGEASLAYRQSFLGEEREVLMEEGITVNGAEYLAGHTREYVKAAIPWDGRLRGMIVRGRLKRMLNEEIVLLEPSSEPPAPENRGN